MHKLGDYDKTGAGQAISFNLGVATRTSNRGHNDATYPHLSRKLNISSYEKGNFTTISTF
jgi:hypothetical protein